MESIQRLLGNIELQGQSVIVVIALVLFCIKKGRNTTQGQTALIIKEIFTGIVAIQDQIRRSKNAETIRKTGGLSSANGNDYIAPPIASDSQLETEGNSKS